MKSYFLIYDDACPICVEATRRVQGFDDLGLINLVPLSLAAMPKGQPAPSPEKMANQMHLVCSDGRVWAGADAVGRLATVFPRSRLMGQFLMLPGVRQIARFVYSQVARHRLRLSSLINSI